MDSTTDREPQVVTRGRSAPYLRRFIARRLKTIILLGLFLLLGLRYGLASRLNTSEHVYLPTMECVGESEFPQDDFKNRNLLIFAATKESAEQSKHWGNVIGPRYVNRIARWNNDHGQKVLVVPVLDASSGMISYLPSWALKFLIKRLGGDDRDAILLDLTGSIRNQFQPISSSETLLILLGPNSKLQAYSIGDYSPDNATALIAAIDFDVGSQGSSGTRLVPDVR